MNETTNNTTQNSQDDIKKFLYVLWKNKKIFIAFMLLGIFGALFFLYVIIGAKYTSEMVIDLGYVTDGDGGRSRKIGAEETIQNIRAAFIEARKYIDEIDDEPVAVVDKVEVVRDSSGKNVMPYVKVTVVGKEKEMVLEKDQEVLEFVQKLNEIPFDLHIRSLENQIENLERRIDNINNVEIPYIENKITALDSDIEEFRKEFRKESSNLAQTQTLTVYINQLDQNRTSYEQKKNNFENEVLVKLEQEKQNLEIRLSNGGIQNAFVLGDIQVTSKRVVNAKKWLILLLGAVSGVVLGAVVIFGRELLNEFDNVKQEVA